MKTFMKIVAAVLLLSVVTGCGNRFDPLSPRNKQSVQNQGKIEELKTNQDSIVADMLKLRQDQQIIARDMDKVQTGQFNKQNTGVQLFQGDGALIAIVVLVGMVLTAGVIAAHFKSEAAKSEKTANVLAAAVARHNNEDLNDSVFTAAMGDSDVESRVYHLVVKHQRKFGLR